MLNMEFVIEGSYMDKVTTRFASSGAKREADIEVRISYEIIQHVSRQLYTNPRKAIEELVTNSYDAGATECWVKLPQNPEDNLIVLDNGKSMDLEGLKGLWSVARSPKYSSSGDRIANERMQIGKFGVGKLAAYALGARLTHITCVDNDIRMISVAQEEIKQKNDGRPPSFA